MDPTVRHAACPSCWPASAAEVLSGSTNQLRFRDRVAALRQDTAMKKLAMRYARDRDVAEDALQETCYAVMTVRDPGRIDDLPRYFRRVLQRKVVEMLELSGPLPTDDPDTVLAVSTGSVQRPGTRRPIGWGSPSEDRAVRRRQSSLWLVRLARLSAVSIPGRSADPQRYRRVIATVARLVLP